MEYPGDPKNWAVMRKWTAIFVMSSFVLMSPLSSTIVAAALLAIPNGFCIGRAAVEPMVLSVSLLGLAYGPLVASPLSEIYGRVRVVQIWNSSYTACNAACGWTHSKEAMTMLRSISGVCGNATLGNGGGTLSDLFRAKDRGKTVAIYSRASVLASLINAKKTDDVDFYTEFDHLDGAIETVFLTNLVRPFKLLSTQPIVQVLALYNTYLYGNICILYVDFIDLWTNMYHESTQIAGLNHLSIAIGSAIAAECWFPELRVPIMVPATLLLAVAKMYCIMPNIDASVSVAGCVYDQAHGGVTFSLYAPYLYLTLRYGWAGSLLGFIGFGIGLLATFLLSKFGGHLRSQSPYASKVS
ncbi:MFS general substrate transporter [Polychaeton citri CBS 116435]|uniref:MFS general substrate transporter n=1 Tax=Polychaeton citri CBS 116435 TaxID=1314669 RepID=A0A9P4UP51_9PEZI|nr:MFS general substrate transporter [Polychaeton citri CBS 116435]